MRRVHSTEEIASVRKDFATRLLPSSADAARLLTVPEVAERLGLSTATIYKFCDRGDLAHVRLSTNTVRVTAADLMAFVSARRPRSGD
jgi:excisionase family DNA binding protein